jgi:hypothetical protein
MKKWVAGFLGTLLFGVGQARILLISMDGLRPDAVTIHGPEMLPNFYRLRIEGAFTDNARTDVDYTNTLPNHTSMVTGRPVLGPCGHLVTVNSGGADTLLHRTGYTAGMFDVAHDRGFSTAMFATKSKFAMFSGQYDEERGAPDLFGVDNGRDKLDHFQFEFSTAAIIPLVVQSLTENLWDLSMLHLRTLDSVGHSTDWNVEPGSSYMNAVITLDGYLGQIFEMIDQSPEFAGQTHIILTSDHGGTQGTFTHTNPVLRTNYRIPFYVWGPGVQAGVDLYQLNPDYHDPGDSSPTFYSPTPPIRNGMAGNLALDLLELPSIPKSCFNVSQQLRVGQSQNFRQLFPDLDPTSDDNGNGFSNFFDYAIGADPLGLDREDLRPTMRKGMVFVTRRINSPDIAMHLEISSNLQGPWRPLYEGLTYLVGESEETPEGRRLRLQIPMLLKSAFFRVRFEEADAH